MAIARRKECENALYIGDPMTFADIIKETIDDVMQEHEAIKTLKVWMWGESLPEWLSPFWEPES